MLFRSYQKVISFAVSQYPVLPHYIPALLQKLLSRIIVWLLPYFPALQACLQQPKKGRRFVCGMFTSSEQDCHIACMVKNILDCPPENSFWFYGNFDEHIRTGPEFPFEFESVIDISEPWACRKLSTFNGAYFRQVRDVLSQLTADDTLFLVLCGRGSERGPLLIGNEDSYFDLWPSSLEMAVERRKAKVQLIIPARLPCWVSPHWRLLTVGTFTQHQLDVFSQSRLEATPTSDSKSSVADTDTPMSEEDEVELIRLAQEHLHFLPPVTLSEAYLASKCTALLKPRYPPGRPLTNEEKVTTLNALRERATLRIMALNIAQKLGFQAGIDKIGDPFGKQRLLGTDLPLQTRAIDHGYILYELHVPMIDTLWMGVAGWLARTWEAAGEPTIACSEWKRVLKESCREAGVTLR